MHLTNNPTELLCQIGNTLYNARHAKREKIVAVAQSIGVSHTVISKIENGKYKALNLQLLTKLAAYYDLEVADLIVLKR